MSWGRARAAMSWSEIIFTTVGGLRGAISLILVQQVVTESTPGQEGQKVTAEVGSCPASHPLCCGHALTKELEQSISVWCRLAHPGRAARHQEAAGGPESSAEVWTPAVVCFLCGTYLVSTAV